MGISMSKPFYKIENIAVFIIKKNQKRAISNHHRHISTHIWHDFTSFILKNVCIEYLLF